MDGTLFDTEFIFQRIWNEIAGEMGLVLPDSFKYEICGTNGAVMNGVIEKYYHVSDGQVIQNECRRRVDKIFARYVPEKPDYFRVFCRPGLAALVMGLAAWAVRRLLAALLPGGLATLLAVIIAAAVYAGAALLLGAVDREELLALPGGAKLARLLRLK